ncbi:MULTISPECIES: hypothetical protein [Pseudomonadota]|uniref:Uncharacterized protein n=1 Tax=Ralstonia pickettii OR214 TaxID=1264675 RepID=R0DZZ4_RALPI|nr:MULTISPECIES: hypothetical protein [Pseudomonadota]ENZ74887.1 hypothetical protein OR214_05159 [Ralstonia pickettii OR214]MBE3061986.1 hypothetical protein [Cutibacterium acnes]MCM3583987.1 hypothetical protein [Ralstonia pickettii]MDR9387317.1 hypothetical protein [Ralstonia sp. 11b]
MTVTVARTKAGVVIEGEHLQIYLDSISWIEPDDATVAISVAAKSANWDDWANMTYEQRCTFTAAGVELVTTEAGADELRCLRRDCAVPSFRMGFTLTLEPGMRAFLTTELPKIELVSKAGAAVRMAVEPHLARERRQHAQSTITDHEAAIINRIVAKVILDGYTFGDALRYGQWTHDDTWAFSDSGDHPQYAELGAALRKPDVIAAIEASAEVAA